MKDEIEENFSNQRSFIDLSAKKHNAKVHEVEGSYIIDDGPDVEIWGHGMPYLGRLKKRLQRLKDQKLTMAVSDYSVLIGDFSDLSKDEIQHRLDLIRGLLEEVGVRVVVCCQTLDWDELQKTVYDS